MKPVEKIKDIRIIDMGQGGLAGLNGQANGGNGGSTGAQNGLPGAGGGTLPDNIVQALMSYRMQAPLVDELMEELGFKPEAGVAAMWPQLSTKIQEDADTPAKPAGKANGKPAPKPN